MITYLRTPAKIITCQKPYFYHAEIMIKIYTAWIVKMFTPTCLEKCNAVCCIFPTKRDEEYVMRALWCEARQKNLCQNHVDDFIPLPVRPGKIVTCHQTFEAHGQKRPRNLMFRSTILTQGNGNSRTVYSGYKRANAMRHMTETRPDDGQPNVIKAPKRYARGVC